MSNSNWSEPFNSRIFFLKEAYHRILVNLDLCDPHLLAVPVETLTQSLQRLMDVYFLHFCLSWDPAVPLKPADFTARVQHLLTAIRACQTPHNLALSLCLPISALPTVAPVCDDAVLGAFQLLAVDVEAQTHTPTIRTQLLQFPPITAANALPLALVGFPSDDDVLDAFLERETPALPSLAVLGVQTTQMPNLRTRAIDLVHSYRFNALVGFPRDALFTGGDGDSDGGDGPLAQQIAAQFASFAARYDAISPLCFVGKVYLQLGPLLQTPPLAPSALPVASLTRHWARLVHPFVHRRRFVSEHRVVALAIDDDDVDAVVALSETQAECLRDTQRLTTYATVAPVLPPLLFATALRHTTAATASADVGSAS